MSTKPDQAHGAWLDSQAATAQGRAEGGKSPQGLSVSFEGRGDLFAWGYAGLRAKGFTLWLKNESDGPVASNCVLMFDRTYRCKLGDLAYYDADHYRTVVYQRPLRPHTAVSFIFDHDVSNHGVCVDEGENALPAVEYPKRLDLVCGTETRSWIFERGR